MIIFGIDPGLATIGYSIIKSEGDRNTPLDYGVILTPQKLSFPERLEIIENSVNRLIDRFMPDEIAIEELFFNTNQKTAIAVSHARGVIISTCFKKCKKIFEYTPLQIKLALTGYGKADKKQIQSMVKCLLSLKATPKPDDAADALAVALTHANTKRFSNAFQIK